MYIIKGNIIADLWLFDTSKGGRKSALPADVFRTTVDMGHEYSFSCAVLLYGQPSIFPGKGLIAPIAFLCWNDAQKYFKVGQEFKIWEGKQIGGGVVREICAAHVDEESGGPV